MSPLLEGWEGKPLRHWRELWGVPLLEVHDRIGSTNDRALEFAARGTPPFGVVIALEQTSGRGRRGAPWHSPPGSGLWMSVLLPGGAHPAPHLPLLVGLAVAEAIEGEEAGAAGSAKTRRIGIKWPNDLLLGGKKLGGILCESGSGGVVAGIGLNVRDPPGGFPGTLRQTATSLEKNGFKMLSFSVLAGSIVRSLEARLARPAARLAPGDLEALCARDALSGRAIHTEEHGPGVAAGLDLDGALLLERPDGSRVRVLSGTVRSAG